MLKSSVRSDDDFYNENRSDGHKSKIYFDGTPCAVKVACTVWVRGKNRDNIKILPIDISYLTNTPAIKGCVR